MTYSTDRDVQQRFQSAGRQLGTTLISRVHEVVQAYWDTSGLRPEVVVVLAGTNIVAALRAAPRSVLLSWTFDRKTGVLDAAVLRQRIIVCEDQDLPDMDYRIMLPTQEDMLGRPTSARGTLAGAVR